MITIKARGWQQFLAAFGVLRTAGVELIAGGGNQMRVPDDTDRSVLRAAAATGAAVHADLTEPATTKSETDVETPDAEEPETAPTAGDGASPDAADPAASDETAPEAPEATVTADETPPAPPASPRKATRPRTRKTKE